MKFGQLKDILTIGVPLDPAIAVLDIQQISLPIPKMSNKDAYFSPLKARRQMAQGAKVEAGAVAIVHDRDVTLSDLPVPSFPVEDPRAALAHCAARFFPKQPEIVVAVTGTSGKTSVAAFLRQIFSLLPVTMLLPLAQQALTHQQARLRLKPL